MINKTYIYLILFTLLMLTEIPAVGQTTKKDNKLKGTFRPYSLWEIYFYNGFVKFDPDESTQESFRRFHQFRFGFSSTGYKNALFAPGVQFEMFTGFGQIYLTDEGMQRTPDTTQFAKEAYRSYTGRFALTNRISFSTGGKSFAMRHPNLYLELGAAAVLHATGKYITWQQAADFGTETKIVHRGVRRNPELQGFARIGVPAISIWGTWRFNRFFKRNGLGLPEPPRLTFGASLDIPLFPRSRPRPGIIYASKNQ